MFFLPRNNLQFTFVNSVLQVSELEEFESSVSALTGLKNWRIITCAGTSTQSSQAGSSDLIYKLDQEPALKYAITGDKSIIITPTLLPPSQKSIEEWHKGRLLFKQLKKENDKRNKKEKLNKDADEYEKQTEKEFISKNSVKSKEQVPESTANVEEKDKGQKQTKKYRLNLFTGKRELMDVEDSDTSSQKSSQEDTEQKNDTDVTGSGDAASQPSSESLKDSNDTTKADATSGDPSVLHSTPVVRRQSTELFESECTPIASGGSGSQEETHSSKESQREGAEAGFVTPKRIRPLRRLSSKTESTLRKAILSSQAKVRDMFYERINYHYVKSCEFVSTLKVDLGICHTRYLVH